VGSTLARRDDRVTLRGRCRGGVDSGAPRDACGSRHGPANGVAHALNSPFRIAIATHASRRNAAIDVRRARLRYGALSGICRSAHHAAPRRPTRENVCVGFEPFACPQRTERTGLDNSVAVGWFAEFANAFDSELEEFPELRAFWWDYRAGGESGIRTL
jgi:hypothetical protein